MTETSLLILLSMQNEAEKTAGRTQKPNPSVPTATDVLLCAEGPFQMRCQSSVPVGGIAGERFLARDAELVDREAAHSSP